MQSRADLLFITNAFNNTGTQILGYVYSLTLNYFVYRVYGVKMLRICQVYI